MTYGGGQVELVPKVYLVFWGWPSAGDPAASLAQNFVSAIGGTPWAGIDTQYYESVGGQQDHISNPTQLLAGVWFDNTNPIHDNLSMQEIGNEALRGVQHFGITDLADSNVVVLQPKDANDAGFNQGEYCAWHDWSTDGYSFPAGTLPFAFTSIPYVLNAGAGCGQDFVNTAPGGDLDGVTIVLGHEIAEAITDPGSGVPGNTGWMDVNQNENGDKCAWVNIGPGSAGNITGNDGRSYAVQSLWDNQQLLGLGYCSG
jgi:serine protease